MADSSSAALTTSPPEAGTTAAGTERELPPLPPVDRGRLAWSFIAASFLVETLLWGPLFSSGVFLKYYTTEEPYASSASDTSIALIGTIGLCAGYGAGLPLLYAYNRHPHRMKQPIWAGLALYTGSLLLASFVVRIEALVVLQGLFPGLAAALCAFPIIRWIPEWFDARKGLAAGIIFSGGGVGGAFLPFVIDALIHSIGIAWTLRAISITTAVLAGTAICFVNPRIPIPRSTQPRTEQSSSHRPMPSFWKTFLQLGFLGCFLTTLLQGFGFFNVGLFIPRISDQLGPAESAGLLSAFNVSCIAAQIMWGHFTDRMRPATAMAASSAIGCLLVLLVWGFGGSGGLAMFAPFAISFGLASGGFSSMWSQSAFAIAGPDKDQQSMLFFGWSVARGLGAAIGPIAGSALYAQVKSPSGSGWSWGSAGSPGFVGLIGASLAASAVVGLIMDRAVRGGGWRDLLGALAPPRPEDAVRGSDHGLGDEGEGIQMGRVSSIARR